jgi:prolyl oligopeptidase
MNHRTVVFLVPVFAALVACQSTKTPDVAPPAERSTEVRPPVERPPVARTVDVVEDVFGRRVADPYRWMEGTPNEEFTTWLRAQGAFAAKRLAALPRRDALHARIRELGLGSSGVGEPQIAGGRTFFFATGANEQLAKLVVREPDGTKRVLADPTVLGAGTNTHYSINGFAPSPDGSLVAYNLAGGGGEITTVRVVDVQTGKARPDVIDRIWGEFPVAWLNDGTGFFYTQMAAPAAGVDPMMEMKVRLHRLGADPATDPVVFGRGVAGPMTLAPEEFPFVEMERGTDWLIASAGGARSEARIAVAKWGELDVTGRGATSWREVAKYEDEVEGALVHGERVYLLSRKGAPNRRLVSVSVDNLALTAARVDVPEDPDAVLTGFAPAKDWVYLKYRVAGLGRMWLTSFADFGTRREMELPFQGTIDALTTDPARDGATIEMEGWSRPGELFAGDVREFRPTGVAATTVADHRGIVADEIEVASFDGAKVPLSILRPRDFAFDGSHPTILTGYAAYGDSQSPWFSPTIAAWIEKGGVFAVCHARGGGEKGYRWQEGGSHAKKMNGVRDVIACAEFLQSKRFTSTKKLAVIGGSMGGILMGRAITERPDLFAAAVIQVGVLDPIRMLHAENGANQMAELGDPETEQGFRDIWEMDSYQHVQDGVAYPAVLFTVGLNDARVAPWMTGKTAARMQAASTSGRPILIRVDGDSGHGIGDSRDQAYAQRADIWAFLLSQFDR